MISVVGQVGEDGVENLEAFEDDGGVGVKSAERNVAQDQVQLGNHSLSVILVVRAREKSVQCLKGGKWVVVVEQIRIFLFYSKRKVCNKK